MRRSWILNLLLLAAVVVAGTRFWSAWREPLPALPGPPTAARGAMPDASSATTAEEARAPESYDGIVARDLFSPARGIIAVTAVKGAGAAVKTQPPPKMLLYGVVIVDADKTAFLQEGAQEAKPRKVREGEPFAGGKLTVIRPDGVTLLFAGTEVNVPLRTPKETVAPPPSTRQAEQPIQAPTQPGAAQQPQFQTPQRGVPPQIRPPGVRVPSGSPQSGQAIPTAPRPEPPKISPPTEAGGGGEQEYFQEHEGMGAEAADEGEAPAPFDGEGHEIR